MFPGVLTFITFCKLKFIFMKFCNFASMHIFAVFYFHRVKNCPMQENDVYFQGVYFVQILLHRENK